MNAIPEPRRRTTARARARAAASDCVVGYLRVSTQEQADSGLGLDAQRAAIEATCAAKGWTVTSWAVDEGVSGSIPPEDRPALSEALDILAAFDAGALVAAKVDRISRDTADLLDLHERSKSEGWALVALDLGVDTSTPTGALMLTMLGAFATWEREQIKQRTRDALASKKARGVRLGRPVDPETEAARARARDLLQERLPLAQVADQLNAEGYRTPTGLDWNWKRVQRLRDSLRLDDEAASAALL